MGAAKTLLRAGADKMIRDGDGKLPADLAKAAGHDELAKLLAPPAATATNGGRKKGSVYHRSHSR
jgi:ankyrin repeat protein